MKLDGKVSTEAERKEWRYVGIKRIRLQYLKDSKKKMGLALWNVLEPKLTNYNYGPDSGIPTLSIEGLREKGLI